MIAYLIVKESTNVTKSGYRYVVYKKYFFGLFSKYVLNCLTTKEDCIAKLKKHIELNKCDKVLMEIKL